MTKPINRIAATLVGIAALAISTPSFAAACGGSLSEFLAGVKQEAIAKGLSTAAADRTLANAAIDNKVLRRDRAQGVFKMTFTEFTKRLISANRMQNGKKNLAKYADVFARAEFEYGVPGAVITAFWGLETDFGAVQGDFNTVNALVTLSHDCRRPELFRPQLIAAIEMVQHNDLDPARTTGAWAGEIGQVQMLPLDIIRFGVDADGDGHVRLKKSAPDAILTAANFIRHLGWQANQPWLQEVTVPSDMAWQGTGLGKALPVKEWEAMGVNARQGTLPSGELSAALLLPQGRKGPAFLAYPNFSVYLEWNKSFIYTTTAAYFGTRLAGAGRYDPGNPDQGLSDAQMKQLQTILNGKGYDVGKIDGILGAGTRAAVQAEQMRLGMPADAWPTPQLLQRLR
ncbi:lytic murein transglycosylase [Hoeflea prorocentri]|uniref:Lytic murein transglycosylase n=1 Tax=Hoeflea prorocentri TaxID=1922333 RepID=A0A9X3ZFN4_9HYPH|nr:lytic murein transglycosylase [Hoeflea prorocentri]MCY6379887.1 lytic murein transglycosylase [Hoeflea prorocentri]MDA5397687.1 lytic murein transglycosylase [Hoeflea prorocentri]